MPSLFCVRASRGWKRAHVAQNRGASRGGNVHWPPGGHEEAPPPPAGHPCGCGDGGGDGISRLLKVCGYAQNVWSCTPVREKPGLGVNQLACGAGGPSTPQEPTSPSVRGGRPHPVFRRRKPALRYVKWLRGLSSRPGSQRPTQGFCGLSVLYSRANSPPGLLLRPLHTSQVWDLGARRLHGLW